MGGLKETHPTKHTYLRQDGESPQFSSIAGCSSPPAKPGINPPPPAASVASQSEAELCRVSKRNPACKVNLQKLPQGHTVLLNTAHLLLRNRDSPHSFKDQNEYKYHQEQIFEHPSHFFVVVLHRLIRQPDGMQL